MRRGAESTGQVASGFLLPPAWATLVILTTILAACAGKTEVTAPAPIVTEPEHARLLLEAETAHARARTLFQQGRYLDAVQPAVEAVTIRERLLGPQHTDLASSLMMLGEIRSTLIQLDQAKPLFERSLAMRKALLGSLAPQVGESLVQLGALTYAAGDFLGSVRLLEESLFLYERALGSSHPDVAVALTHLAIAERGLSQLEAGRTHVARAIAILRKADPPRTKDLAIAVNVAGNIMGRMGHFEEGRSLLEESLHLFEQASGPEHPHVGGALVQLAMLEGKQGNHRGALPLLEHALTINERAYGTNNPEIAGTLYELGLAERALGNTASAQQRFARALAIQQATIDSGHPFIALTLIELAEGKRLEGDSVSARGLLQQALRIQEDSLGRDHTSVAITLTNLGYLEAQANRLSEAEQAFSRAVRIREKALGAGHRDVSASLLDLARAKHAKGDLADARALYERARVIIQAQAGKNPGLDDEALGRIWKKDLKGLQDYALLLAMLARASTNGPEQQSAVADGFAVTQQARGWLMQAAVAKTLAQGGTGSQMEVALAKRMEDLRRKRQELWTRLNALYGLPESQRDASELGTTKALLATVQEELDKTTAQLHRTAPRYAELAQPESLGIQDTQRLLRPKEVLVAFYTLADRVQIWALRSDKAIVYREAMIDRPRLVKLVQQIRDSLLPRVHPETGEGTPAPFDVESAAEVYQLLFAPISASLQDAEHLILVPDDVLTPLPFAALLMQKEGEPFSLLRDLYRRKHLPTPTDLASYGTLPWLAKSFPLTVLPTASALKLLRQHAVTGTDRGEPFIGFGDPVLQGTGSQRGGKMVASRGMRVVVDSLKALDSLPGTRKELLAIADVLRVNPDTSLFLGERATELEVRRLNANGRLGQARILSFATHGLLAGEVQGVTQPALVLTPPATLSEENDGLLSMEDILQLKLHNTDWVILSACNTAGDDGSGESLSGLARAFFFAGAKGLLVSQWSVDDEATRSLMAAIFTRYGGPQRVSPAKALQEGMLTLLDQAGKDPEKRYFAHPYAWAAFLLVGDGAPRASL